MKYAFLLIVILALFAVGCSQTTDRPQQAPINSNGQEVVTTTAADSSGTQTMKVSQSELASHNTEADCWIAYQGNVYDVTGYVPIHPGGAAQIVPLCGTSGQFENAFTMKHGTSKVSVLEKQGVYKGLLE